MKSDQRRNAAGRDETDIKELGRSLLTKTGRLSLVALREAAGGGQSDWLCRLVREIKQEAWTTVPYVAGHGTLDSSEHEVLHPTVRSALRNLEATVIADLERRTGEQRALADADLNALRGRLSTLTGTMRGNDEAHDAEQAVMAQSVDVLEMRAQELQQLVAVHEARAREHEAARVGLMCEAANREAELSANTATIAAYDAERIVLNSTVSDGQAIILDLRTQCAVLAAQLTHGEERASALRQQLDRERELRGLDHDRLDRLYAMHADVVKQLSSRAPASPRSSSARKSPKAVSARHG